MLEQVRATLGRFAMTAPGDRVLVAVSGGPDSLALLHCLHLLAPELRIALHVYHLDHGLRGEQSADDSRFVVAEAARLGLPCTAERVDVAAEVARTGETVQAAARRVRYARLEAVADAVGASRIATGHNRGDQAETVLMRLLRGSGLRGLAGIPPVRGGRFIRPLLGVSRADIEDFLCERSLVPRRDPSNDKAVYTRNRIRLELVPLLETQYNPQLVPVLAATAERLRQDADYLEQATHEVWTGLGASDGLGCAALLAQHPAIAVRLVRRLAAPLLPADQELSSGAVERALAAARRGGTGEFDLEHGLVAAVAYGRLRIWSRAAAAPVALAPVPVPGEVDVPELGVRVRTVLLAAGQAQPPAFPDEVGRACFETDGLPGPLAVRTRRPGDRIWPVGMTGSQKLQDLFTDRKVPRHRRDRVPLLVCGDAVLWVVGYRLDRRFILPPGMVAASVLVTVHSLPEL